MLYPENTDPFNKMFAHNNMSSALVAIAIVFFVILCVTGTAAGGLYFAGREDKTLELELEANERWQAEMEKNLEEEATQYQDPRSRSFQTRNERSPGFGALPLFPSGAYYRRRPTESSLTWAVRSDVLPDKGPDSYTIAGNPQVIIENITDDEIQWNRFHGDAWTNLFAKDPLRVDCGSDALNSFQIRSEKFSIDRNIVKAKKDEQTGTKLNYRHQYKSYHDNYKQLYKCLTGSEGWKWDGDERAQIGGDFKTPITDDKTRVMDGKKLDGNQTKVMDCDFEAVGETEFGRAGAGKNYPMSMLEPKWDRSVSQINAGRFFSTHYRFVGPQYPDRPQTNDFKPDPRTLDFKYQCLKQPARGPCKEMKYTEWTPFIASQGNGPRELHHMLNSGQFSKTSGETHHVPTELKQYLNPTIDPVKGLGRVRCHPTEVLTRVDWEISEGLDAPKDWIRFGYKCCKL